MRFANTVGKWEAKIRLKKLLDIRPANIFRLFNLNDAEDLRRTSHQYQKYSHTSTDTHVDGPETGTVASCHVLIERFYSVRASELSELLVHVVCSGARIVADPYAKILHFQGLLFVNLKG
jgi:hypothetical protein